MLVTTHAALTPPLTGGAQLPLDRELSHIRLADPITPVRLRTLQATQPIGDAGRTETIAAGRRQTVSEFGTELSRQEAVDGDAVRSVCERGGDEAPFDAGECVSLVRVARLADTLPPVVLTTLLEGCKSVGNTISRILLLLKI